MKKKDNKERKNKQDVILSIKLKLQIYQNKKVEKKLNKLTEKINFN